MGRSLEYSISFGWYILSQKTAVVVSDEQILLRCSSLFFLTLTRLCLRSMKSQSEELLSCEPALNIGLEWNVAVEVLFGFDCCFDFTHTQTHTHTHTHTLMPDIT